jgi:cysteine desulfurase
MFREVYMDHAATTYMKEEVIEEMKPYLIEYFGNPSSIYQISRKTKMALDESRMRIAQAINANIDEIYFTAGGSESDNWALKGVALANKNKGNHIITTVIEHHAVLHSCEYLEKLGFQITYLPVNEFGAVDVEDVKKAITNKTILVSVMFANNEIGTIQPIGEIGSICREKGIVFHTDGVQAVGSVPIDVKNMNIDMLSMASHKFYGPKGIGALYIKKGVRIDNLIHGGAQERAKRAGTENVMGIVGMGKAIEIAEKNIKEERKRLSNLRDKMIKELLNIPESKLNGAEGQERLPGNVNVSFNLVDGDTLLMSLDSEGIYASSGSACSAGALEASHVLMAIGLQKDIAKGSLRLTLGYKTTEEDVDYVIKSVKEAVSRIRDSKKKWQ